MKAVVKFAVLAVFAVIAILVSAAAPAQAPPANSQPAQQSAAAPAQQSPAAPAAQAPAATAQPAGTRRPAQAKTQDEINAYNAIRRMSMGAEAEAAAKDFEARFPQSELRPLLYQNLMDAYQSADNADQAIAMGHRSVALDPDNTVVLVMLANLLAERTRDTDLDHDQRYAEAMHDAQHGLDTMATSLVVPPGTTPGRVLELKQLLTALAHSAMGFVELNRHNDAAAELHLRQSAQLNTLQPDAMVYLRLAIALDHQAKYTDALTATDKVLELTPNGGVADLARQEKDRLLKLTGPAVAPVPPSAQPQAPPATAPPPADKPKD
jgi:tetratricopeptide (TPR) repeat protein